ncbi:MAG TPA: hypothetical protein DDW25_00665 [Ktedonobacter sp.]|nr:hypothetical protein [Ktedonobacter sp.]
MIPKTVKMISRILDQEPWMMPWLFNIQRIVPPTSNRMAMLMMMKRRSWSCLRSLDLAGFDMLYDLLHPSWLKLVVAVEIVAWEGCVGQLVVGREGGAKGKTSAWAAGQGQALPVHFSHMSAQDRNRGGLLNEVLPA